MQKVLIVQTAFIGDLVLTTPLIRAVKEGLPGAWVSVLVIPATAELLEGNPWVNQVVVYDKRGRQRGVAHLLTLAHQLRRQRFDLALVPHRSLRSALLVYLARIPKRVGFHNSAGSFLFTDQVFYQRGVHEVERNLDLAHHLGLGVDHLVPQLFPPPEDRAFASRFLEAHGAHGGKPLVGISPGSVWPTKRWLPERFAQVADRLQEELGVRVVLLGGREDQELCRQIGGVMTSQPLIAAGETTLLQSAALLKRCRLLLSNDSAPVHLAVAMGVPVVDIFGPTVPAFGFGPYGDGHAVVEKDLACRPCSIHGGSKCSLGTFECMRGIEADEVYQVVLNNLKRVNFEGKTSKP